MATVSIREAEIETPTGSYQTMFAEGVNQDGSKLVVRNTTTSRIQLRFNEDDNSVVTVSPSESFIIGSFANFRGQKIEMKSVTDIASSVRVNVYG